MVSVSADGQSFALARILTEEESAAVRASEERARAAARELAEQIASDRILQPFGRIFSKDALRSLEFGRCASGETAELRRALFDHAPDCEMGDLYNGLQAAVHLMAGPVEGISKFDQTFEFVNSAGSKIPMRWEQMVDLAREIVVEKLPDCRGIVDPQNYPAIELGLDRLNSALKYGRVHEIRARIDGPVTAENARSRKFLIYEIEDEFEAGGFLPAPPAEKSPPTR